MDSWALDFKALDALSTDALIELVDEHEIAEEKLPDESKQLDFKNFDFAAIFGLGKVEEKEKPYVPRELKTRPFPPGRMEYRPNTRYQRIEGDLRLVSNGNTLRLIGDNDDLLVGFVNNNVKADLVIERSDALTLADVYCEEVGGKGSGLGFSLFLHSAACMSLTKVDRIAVLEPVSGEDLLLEGPLESKDTSPPGWSQASSRSSRGKERKLRRGITIEVTGRNYAKRSAGSSADWVVNKYALLDGLMRGDERLDFFVDASDAEETNQTDFLRNSSLDNGPSEYTSTMDEMHDLVRGLTPSQLLSLQHMSANWFSRRSMGTRPAPVVDRSMEDVKAELVQGGKANAFLRNKQIKKLLYCKDFRKKDVMKLIDARFPAPLRVMPRPECTPLETIRRQDHKVEPGWNDMMTHSTFHTLRWDDDPCARLYDVNLHTLKLQGLRTTLSSHMECRMIGRLASASIVTECDLISKIRGGGGYYYSSYHRVGITWYRQNRNALVWQVNYYCFGDPGDEKIVGKWAYDTTSEVNKSPTFKISRQDIQFYSTLRSRMLNVYASCLNMCTIREWEGVERSINELFAIWNNSSWITSKYAADARFITNGHLCGNPLSRNLVMRSMVVDSSLRSSEYIYLKKMWNHLNVPRGNDLTPLLGLPLKLHCLEKDIALGMNWVVRGVNHDTGCMKKLIKAYHEELEGREVIIQCYKDQVEFLRGAMQDGAVQSEFDDMMSRMPVRPHMCIPFYLGCCEEIKDEILAAASRQMSTSFSINKLVSDRKCSASNHYGTRMVADELYDLLRSLDVKGPFHMMYQLLRGDKILNEYLIVSKGGKSSDREIAIQKIKQRVFQLYKELMQGTVSTSLPSDALMDRYKYGPMVTRFTEIFNNRHGAVTSSEDRSFHCGNNHPEAMSLASLSLAKVSGSNHIISCAAMQRLDTIRSVIFPFNYENSEPDFKHTRVIRHERSAQRLVPKMELRYHAMQGLQSTATGVINATYNSATMRWMSKITNMITEWYIIVTSDDVGRAVALKRGAALKLKLDIIFRPLQHLNLVSMVNNSRKLIDSINRAFAEVNNISMTQDGMITQSPIHGVITCQPLNSDSVAADLLQVISDARSTIFWGDPPNLAMIALESGLRMLREKWLIRQEDMDLLYVLRLVPTCASELVEGFSPRTVRGAKILWLCLREGDRKRVLERSLNFSHGLLLRSANPRKEAREFKAFGLDKLDIKLSSVRSARQRGNRVNASFMRHRPVGATVKLRNRFFDLLKADTKDVELPDDLPRPPRVKMFVKPMVKEDRLPTLLGQTSEVSLPDLKAIRCWRSLRVKYRTDMTDQELEIAELKDEQFVKRMGELNEISRVVGMSGKAPGGMPVVRWLDGKKYVSKPHCAGFSVSIDPTPMVKRPFSYRGTEVTDFKPCLYSSKSLDMARKNKLMLAFGTGKLEGKKVAFFRPKRRDATLSITTRKDQHNMEVVNVKDGRLLILNRVDASLFMDVQGQGGVIAGVTGSAVALANYGRYAWTNSKGAFNNMERIFRSFDCVLPQFVREHMPDYPWFPNCEVISGHDNYLLEMQDTRGIQLVCDGATTAVVRREDGRVIVEPLVQEEESWMDF